mgnify:CR=1 FL=1
MLGDDSDVQRSIDSAGGARDIDVRIRNNGDLQPKVQTKFTKPERDMIERTSKYHGVSNAEVVRGAFRVFWWACRQVRAGFDVGAYDRSTGRFIAVDIPYATEVDVPDEA